MPLNFSHKESYWTKVNLNEDHSLSRQELGLEVIMVLSISK